MAIVLFVGFGLAALRNNDKKNAEIARLSVRIKQIENARISHAGYAYHNHPGDARPARAATKHARAS